jgi:hypothetical protein
MEIVSQGVAKWNPKLFVVNIKVYNKYYGVVKGDWISFYPNCKKEESDITPLNLYTLKEVLSWETRINSIFDEEIEDYVEEYDSIANSIKWVLEQY